MSRFVSPFDLVREQINPLGARIEAATVAAINTTSGTVTVSVAGGTNIAGIPVAAGAMPAVGDKVWMLRQGTTGLCLVGKVTQVTYPEAVKVKSSLAGPPYEQLRLTRTGSANSVLLRNDGTNFYFLLSDTEDGTWNALRPLRFDVTTGKVTMANGVDITGDLAVTGNISATLDVTATGGDFFGSPTIARLRTAGPGDDYVEVDDTNNRIRMVLEGAEEFRLENGGNLAIGGDTLRFGIASNDYIQMPESGNYLNVFVDGVELARLSAGGVFSVSTPYGVDAYRSTAQSLAHQTWTTIICNNVTRYNKGSDYSTSTGKYTAPVEGFYAFGGTVRMDTAQAFTDVRCAVVHSTGASYEGTWFNDSTGENGPFVNAFGMRYLSAGETLELRGYQANGASATRNTDTNNCRFWAVRLT